jgi:hypothetical protein
VAGCTSAVLSLRLLARNIVMWKGIPGCDGGHIPFRSNADHVNVSLAPKSPFVQRADHRSGVHPRGPVIHGCVQWGNHKCLHDFRSAIDPLREPQPGPPTLGRRLDVVMTVRIGRTDREVDQRAAHQLISLGARALGSDATIRDDGATMRISKNATALQAWSEPLMHEDV